MIQKIYCSFILFYTLFLWWKHNLNHKLPHTIRPNYLRKTENHCRIFYLYFLYHFFSQSHQNSCSLILNFVISNIKWFKKIGMIFLTSWVILLWLNKNLFCSFKQLQSLWFPASTVYEWKLFEKEALLSTTSEHVINHRTNNSKKIHVLYFYSSFHSEKCQNEENRMFSRSQRRDEYNLNRFSLKTKLRDAPSPNDE